MFNRVTPPKWGVQGAAHTGHNACHGRMYEPFPCCPSTFHAAAAFAVSLVLVCLSRIASRVFVVFFEVANRCLVLGVCNELLLCFRSLLVAVLWSCSAVFATTPLFDSIEIEGQRGALHQKEGGWLPLPYSEELQEFRRAERCTAIGGPRGEYMVQDDKLWLHSLHRCRGKIEIKEVYPGDGQPILATWVTGELIAEVGESLCMSIRGGFFLREAEITMQLERGVIKSLQIKSNVGHPDCRPSAIQ